MDGNRHRVILLALILGAIAIFAFSTTGLAAPLPGTITNSPAGGSTGLGPFAPPLPAEDADTNGPGTMFAIPGVFSARLGNGLDTTVTVPLGKQQVNVTVSTQDWENFNVGASSPNGGPALQTSGVSRTPTGVRMNRAQLTLPSVDATVAVNGLATGPSGLDWDSMTLAKNEIKLGDRVTISGLTTSLGGASKSYSSDVAAQVDWHGQALQASGAWNLVYDGATQQTNATLQNGSLALQAGGMNMDLAGVSYAADGGFACRQATLSMPSAGLQGSMTGITVKNGVFDFEQAEATYTPAPNAVTTPDRPQLSRFRVNVTKSDAGYTVTTESQFAAPSAGR